jgi:hypothetical protein
MQFGLETLHTHRKRPMLVHGWGPLERQIQVDDEPLTCLDVDYHV